ncbi:MAG: DNA repair protein RadC [Desulforegulaceae bacterium]|nr:DNA repair protein RadC [Desulforegulaceae bacterium]
MPDTKYQKNPNSGHRQRLREKFFESGISSFHDYEIIEILLTLGTPIKDCKPLAKDLLNKFKSLPGVLDAPVKELESVKGLGPANIFPLVFVRAAAEVYLKRKTEKKDVVSCSEDVFNYLYFSMREKDIEIFKVIFLNSKNEITAIEDIHEGSISSSAVYPREIIKSALEKKASALIFAHNHPSGSVEPSKSDISITRRLVHACLHMDIKVHEHLVIGNNKYFSFADEGYIKKFSNEFLDFEKDILING